MESYILECHISHPAQIIWTRLIRSVFHLRHSVSLQRIIATEENIISTSFLSVSYYLRFFLIKRSHTTGLLNPLLISQIEQEHFMRQHFYQVYSLRSIWISLYKNEYSLRTASALTSLTTPFTSSILEAGSIVQA